jgi:hypothetical protein
MTLICLLSGSITASKGRDFVLQVIGNREFTDSLREAVEMSAADCELARDGAQARSRSGCGPFSRSLMKAYRSSRVRNTRIARRPVTSK